MSGLALLFAVSLAGCVYPYFGYPAILWLVSRIRSRPVRKSPIRPGVTVIIPARDEEDNIRRKLENTVRLDYPRDRLEILVASDGSADETETIVRAVDDERVRLLSLPRRGKAHALNVAASEARFGILAFTDADIDLEPESLARLLENFADPEVGGVCGNKRYRPATNGDATGTGESLYWRYDKWQKRLESGIGSVFSADGALHALRRELYVPIRDPAEADDIALSTRVVTQGRRLVFEPGAVTSEDAPAELAREYRRKVRIVNQSFRALLGLGPDLWTSGLYSFELVSHKLLRYFVPFFLVPLYLSTAALTPVHPAFAILLAGQTLVYALAGAGYALRGTRFARRTLFAVPLYFSLVNLAALVGVSSIARGRRETAWTPRMGTEGP